MEDALDGGPLAGYRVVRPAEPPLGQAAHGFVAFYYYQAGPLVFGMQLTIVRPEGVMKQDFRMDEEDR